MKYNYDSAFKEDKTSGEACLSDKNSLQVIQELLKGGKSGLIKLLIASLILGMLSAGLILDNTINVKNMDYVYSDAVVHKVSGISKADVERFAFFIKECEISENGVIWNQVFFQSLTPQIRSQIKIIASDVKFLRSLKMFELSSEVYDYFLKTYTEEFIMLGVPGVGMDAYNLSKTYKNPKFIKNDLQR